MKNETAKLLKVVELKDKQIAESKAIPEEKAKLVESKDAELKASEDSQKKTKQNPLELIAPLSKEQKEIMTNLLSSTN